MAPGRAPFALGGAARADYPDYPYAPGAPPRPRREETYRKTGAAVAGAAAFGAAFLLWVAAIVAEAWFNLGLLPLRDPVTPGVGIAAAIGFAVTFSRWMERRDRWAS